MQKFLWCFVAPLLAVLGMGSYADFDPKTCHKLRNVSNHLPLTDAHIDLEELIRLCEQPTREAMIDHLRSRKIHVVILDLDRNKLEDLPKLNRQTSAADQPFHDFYREQLIALDAAALNYPAFQYDLGLAEKDPSYMKERNLKLPRQPHIERDHIVFSQDAGRYQILHEYAHILIARSIYSIYSTTPTGEKIDKKTAIQLEAYGAVMDSKNDKGNIELLIKDARARFEVAIMNDREEADIFRFFGEHGEITGIPENAIEPSFAYHELHLGAIRRHWEKAAAQVDFLKVRKKALNQEAVDALDDFDALVADWETSIATESEWISLRQ